MWARSAVKGAPPSASTPGSASKSDGGSSSAVVSMYKEHPQMEVTVEEFERYAMERLKVLRGIDEERSWGRKGAELDAAISRLLVGLKGVHKGEYQRSDAISHFVLRLAYCKTEELRRWFLAQECELFRHRFASLNRNEAMEFMKANNLDFEILSDHEFAEYQEELAAVHTSAYHREEAARVLQGEERTFVKVPFERVPDLVATRKVLLKAGMAIVSRDQVASLVASAFRTHLSGALARASRKLAAVLAESDCGLLPPLVAGISTRYLGPEYGVDAGSRGASAAVCRADVPTLAAESFPLCMQHTYSALKRDHHLRHGGRMQLGLFLKGIGLPLEEALLFWKAEFAAKTPSDKFDKNYAYNIRHNYGKEGKRTDYTPHSCMKIINGTPGAGDAHGCPYKTLDPPSLSAALGRLGLERSASEAAVSKAKEGHPQVACGMVFEALHGAQADYAATAHPNQYYEESRRVKDPEAVLRTPGTPSRSRASTPGSAPATPYA